MKSNDPILIQSYHGKNLIFGIPNSFCEWRARTLLTKEPETIKWLSSFKSSDIFWDVGSNIGLYSIFASMIVGCKTYAFEPESQNLAVLNKNVFFNKMDNLIQVYGIGIADRTYITSLGLSKFEAGYSGHELTDATLRFKQGCIVHSISDLIEMGLPIPNHLKVDIDGLEPLVMKGCMKYIKNIDSILIELDQANPNHMEVVEQIKRQGFSFDAEQVERTARPKGTNFENYREFPFTYLE